MLSRDRHPFSLGQPVYFKPEVGKGNVQPYVAVAFSRNLFGPWYVEIVSARDTSGPTYVACVHDLTDEPPVIQHEHASIVHFTGTGRALKSITGGFR